MLEAFQFPEVDETAKVTAFHEKAIWTGVTDQDRGSWLRARSQIITASRVSALLGLSPFEDALDVYADALRPANDFVDVDFGLNDPRTWGSALEEAVARRAGRHYGWNVKMSGCLLVSRKYPHIGCTQDAEVGLFGELDLAKYADLVAKFGPWVSYEGKTTSNFRARDWNEDDEKVPDHVVVQTQTQLLVTGAPLSIVSCLIGGQKFVRVDYEPNEAFFAMIIDAVDEMRDRISRMDPPPATYRSERALKKLYPNDDGTSVMLPKEALEWTAELQDLMPRQTELEKREKELKNLLRQAIGSATVGLLPEEVGGTTQWTNATQHRAGFTTNPTSFKVLRSSSEGKKRK
jgi:predicted phage-related endonuclease